MYCSNCANPIDNTMTTCPRCGQATTNVPAGGAPVPGQPTGGPGYPGQPPYAQPPFQGYVQTVPGAKQRIVYILLGLFLGYLGIHNFYAGYAGRAIAQLLITLLIGWLGVPLLAVWIWVIIEICTVTHDANGVPFTS